MLGALVAGHGEVLGDHRTDGILRNGFLAEDFRLVFLMVLGLPVRFPFLSDRTTPGTPS